MVYGFCTTKLRGFKLYYKVFYASGSLNITSLAFHERWEVHCGTIAMLATLQSPYRWVYVGQLIQLVCNLIN
jgi:hypothetical protein